MAKLKCYFAGYHENLVSEFCTVHAACMNREKAQAVLTPARTYYILEHRECPASSPL